MNFSLEALMSAVLPPETLVQFLRKMLEKSAKINVTHFVCTYDAEKETILFTLNDDPEPYGFEDTKKLIALIREGVARKVGKEFIVMGARVVYNMAQTKLDIKYIDKTGQKLFKQITLNGNAN